MASFAQVATLVYAAVLGPDSASAADLARLAFGVLLWIVLVILNRGAAGGSPRPSSFEVGAVPNPRRRLEPPGAGTRRASRGLNRPEAA